MGENGEVGSLICADAKCNILHIKQGVGLDHPQSQNVIRYVSFMVFTDANPAARRGRPVTNGVGWLSCWEVSLSPQSPITHRDNTSKHQGALAVLYLNIPSFFIHLFSFFLISRSVFSLSQVKK